MAPHQQGDPSAETPDGVSTPAVIGLITGTVVFLGAFVFTAYLYLRRRSWFKQSHDRHLKQFLLPKDVKPVMSFKTAAGPGGLKKSPSPATSPDNPEQRSLMSRSAESSGGNSDVAMNTSSLLDAEDSHVLMDEIDSSDGGVAVEEGGVLADQPPDGRLNFNVRYNFDKNALTVTIMSATTLPPPNSKKSSKEGDSVTTLDPYIKLQLLPEKQHKVKTRVVRNTLNPVYDEEFIFYGLNYNQLQTTTLHFALISFDRYSRDEILGEVLCPLRDVDLSDSDKEASLSQIILTRNLKFQKSQSRGELLVSVCHQPSTNRLTAVVLKARNLPKFDVTGLADPYVKVYLLYNGQRIAKKKTHVKKQTLSPVYNESIVFDLPSSEPEAIADVGLEFFVMDWDRLTKNEVMGACEMGTKVRSTIGRAHWAEVCQCPRKQTAEWHKLRA